MAGRQHRLEAWCELRAVVDLHESIFQYRERRKISDTKSINERRIFFGLCRSSKGRPSAESRSGKSEKRQCFPARKVWSIAHKDCFFGLYENGKLEQQ